MMIKAVKEGDLDGVRGLLSDKVDVNCKDTVRNLTAICASPHNVGIGWLDSTAHRFGLWTFDYRPGIAGAWGLHQYTKQSKSWVIE
ncbi:unnamed protein product [Aphanomyces euteiches]